MQGHKAMAWNTVWRKWLPMAAAGGSVLALAAYAAMFRGQYMLFSAVLAVLAMVPLWVRFELRQTHARELVLLAMMAAIAAVARVPFSALPSVQPTSFLIIVAGAAFGAQSGFGVGAAAALVSNFFLGQGPWTPFQMAAWGWMGMTAGWLGRRRVRVWSLVLMGGVWGLLFGWLMNLVTILSLAGGVSWEDMLLLYGASFPFDLMHALSNMFFLGVFGLPTYKTLRRFAIKYGLGARPRP